MKPFFTNNMLIEATPEDLQLLRRCVGHRMDTWDEMKHTPGMWTPEDEQELKLMREAYQEITRCMEMMPF